MFSFISLNVYLTENAFIHKQKRFLSELEPPQGELFEDDFQASNKNYVFVPFFAVRKSYFDRKRVL